MPAKKSIRNLKCTVYSRTRIQGIKIRKDDIPRRRKDRFERIMRRWGYMCISYDKIADRHTRDSVALRASKRYPMPDNCPLAECSRDDARCFCRSPICPEILETIVGLIPAADSIGQCTRLHRFRPCCSLYPLHVYIYIHTPCIHRSNNDRSRVFGKLSRVENRPSRFPLFVRATNRVWINYEDSRGSGDNARLEKCRAYIPLNGANCGKSDHRIAAWPR